MLLAKPCKGSCIADIDDAEWLIVGKPQGNLPLSPFQSLDVQRTLSRGIKECCENILEDGLWFNTLAHEIGKCVGENLVSFGIRQCAPVSEQSVNPGNG